MVPQHAGAVACGGGVGRPFARPSAECASHPEETREVRGGQPHCPRICDSPPLGSRTEDGQAVVRFNCFMGSVFRIDPHRVDYFVLLDFPVEIQTKATSSSRCCRRTSTAAAGTTGRGNSQCAYPAVCRRRRSGRREGANPPGGAGAFETGKVRTLRLVAKRDSVIRPAWNWQDFPG